MMQPVYYLLEAKMLNCLITDCPDSHEFHLETVTDTSYKSLCVLQFSAHEAFHVVVNVDMIIMIKFDKIIITKHFNCLIFL